MAAGEVYVDVPGMHKASTELQEKAGEVSASEGRVQQLVESLASHWSGDSATTYRNAMRPYYELCEQIERALGNNGGMAEKVINSANKYQQTHEQTVDAAKQLNTTMSSMGNGGLKNF